MEIKIAGTEAVAFNVPDRGLSFIEQLQNLSQNKCSKLSRPFLVGVSESQKLALLTRPACKQWNCPECAAKNARRWIARIINHINKTDEQWFMFTLTSHEKMRGIKSSLKNIREGWKKLYNRMRYEFGVSQYVKVWELHADDTFHLHGLINREIAKKWLKDNARECGMGYQVDFHNVENAGQVAGYIAKYFLKSEYENASKDDLSYADKFPRGLRRIEVSRNWTKLPDLKADTLLQWHIQQTREGQIARAQTYFDRGFDIIDNSRDNDDKL